MSSSKVALITGITGQDGSYLAELLLEKGYQVHGIKRRASLINTQRIDHIYEDPHSKDGRLKLHYGDLTDTSNLTRLLRDIEPDEVYNLGAQSHVAVSFESRLAPCGCSKPSVFLGSRRSLGSIRLRRPNSSGSSRRARSERRHPSIRARPTLSPRCMRTGSR